MNRGVGIFILGMLIVLGAAMGSLYYANSELTKSQTFTLAPGETKNLSYALNGSSEYEVIITADYSLNYSFQYANGTAIKNGTVNDKEVFTFKAKNDGDYVLVLHNSNEKNRVAVRVETTGAINHATSTWQMILGTCIVGVAVVIIGIAVAFMTRKK